MQHIENRQQVMVNVHSQQQLEDEAKDDAVIVVGTAVVGSAAVELDQHLMMTVRPVVLAFPAILLDLRLRMWECRMSPRWSQLKRLLWEQYAETTGRDPE